MLSGPGALWFFIFLITALSSAIVIVSMGMWLGPVMLLVGPVYGLGGGAQCLCSKYSANVSACLSVLTICPFRFSSVMDLAVKSFLSLFYPHPLVPSCECLCRVFDLLFQPICFVFACLFSDDFVQFLFP